MTFAEYLQPGDWLARGAGPLYRRLSRRIGEGIAAGIAGPAGSLPAEREIAALTGLSRVTVRRAIGALTETGTVEPRQGSGTFVRAAVAPGGMSGAGAQARLISFTEDMARRGLEASSVWLERARAVAGLDEQLALGLPGGTEVARLVRLRLAGGVPMALERAALPADLLPDPESVSGSLYARLDAAGRRPVRALQRITAVALPAPDARLLDLAPGAPTLRIERTAYLASGRPVEFTRTTYRGDRYDFLAELADLGTEEGR